MKPSCQYSVAQVRESGLIGPERMAAIEAEIEHRIEKVYDAQGRELPNCQVACFTQSPRMLYPRMDHDLKGDYIRREVMADVFTTEELKLVNAHCWSGYSAATEARRFAEATKLDSWDGWVTDGDHYWDSIESYLDERFDEVDGDPEGTPPHLWVAESQQVVPRLDVGDITEHWICDRGWEEMETGDLDGVDTLQAALDAFVELNRSIVSYHADFKRAVLLAGYLKL